MSDNIVQIYRKRWGRRKGRPLNPVRAQLLDTVLTQYGLDCQRIIENTGIMTLADILRMDDHPDTVHLEIGFGNGEHLIARAQANPDILFIGCEPFINGVAALAKDISAMGITNIRIWNDDAHFLIEKMPPACLSQIYVLFPDPWPKSRHTKRRFIRRDTLDSLARLMKRGTVLRMATDVEDLAHWMLEQAREHPAFEQCEESHDNWYRAPDDWVMTRYQAKGHRAGRRSHYIFFFKK